MKSLSRWVIFSRIVTSWVGVADHICPLKLIIKVSAIVKKLTSVGRPHKDFHGLGISYKSLPLVKDLLAYFFYITVRGFLERFQADFKGNIFKHNKQNKWMHIYPETGLWYYYVPIRPFKRGAAYFAYQYNKPIVPIGYSFRERKGISKLFFKRSPFVTAHIGEPMYPDKTLPKKQAIDELNEKIRTKIMNMVGIESEEENQKLMKECYKYENGHFYTKL